MSGASMTVPILLAFSFAMVAFAMVAFALLTGSALAAAPVANPTPADAKAMLARALDYYQANGREKALDAFNSNRPPFSDRGLYVFCIGPDRTLVADGEFREFIGQSADILKDASGEPLGRAFWDIAQRMARARRIICSSIPPRSWSSRKCHMSPRPARMSAASEPTSRSKRAAVLLRLGCVGRAHGLMPAPRDPPAQATKSLAARVGWLLLLVGRLNRPEFGAREIISVCPCS